MKKMLCVWMMLIAGAVCAQTVLQDVPDATVVGPSNDPFLFSVIRGNAAYGTNALAVANAAKTTAVNASNRIVFSEGTINALVSTQRVVVAQIGALVSTQAVQSVTISNAFALGMAALTKANETLARENMTTNIVNGLSGAVVSNHNASSASHSDIRASVSNAVDLATGAVKTNSVGGLAVGEEAVASGVGSVAIGPYATATGARSFSLGNNVFSIGDSSFAFGGGLIAEHNFSFVWGIGGQYIYNSHGIGTFNIDPYGGPSGFYIGETSLQTFLDARVSVSDFASSNAVTQASIAAKPSAESVTNAVFYRQIADSASSVTSTVSVVPSVSVYRLTATNSTIITFDTSALNTTNQVATWELWVLNASTNNSIIWPSTNSVYYIANPSSISANSQTVYTVWRKYGETIQCNPYLVK